MFSRSRVLNIFMLIDTIKEFRTYYRVRKGKQQECCVGHLVYYLRCDSCGFDFTRTSKTFDKRSFAHVCSDCNQKKFAQKQSSVIRQYNKYDASSSKTI